MGKLFGADGIRGIVNVNLDCALVFRIGQAAAQCLRTEGRKPKVVVGMDTRVSSSMLENAIAAGLCSCGADVIKIGVVPTPGVAFLTKQLHADCGIMISASHAPYLYNGLRFFDSRGFKWNDERENELESLVLGNTVLRTVTQAEIGSVSNAYDEVDQYLAHLASTVGPLSGLRIAVDCANGAASATAHRLLDRYSLDISWLNDVPNGTNINENCGCTNLWNLASTVRAGGFDLGIAFDGDGDRCLVVDEKGRYVDGDQLMSVCALQMAREEKLPWSGFVGTVMSNIGLLKFAEAHGLLLKTAPTGERSLLKVMQEHGFVLGGEQTGHIIFLDHMPTGDGQLTALQILNVLCQTGQGIGSLASVVSRYPQVMLNVPGPSDNAEKRRFLDSEPLMAAVQAAEAELNGDGRCLVRASATEAILRILVEAPTGEAAEAIARNLAQTVESLTKKAST